jgi:ligand-binding SRPBCC domain-containing protein
MAPYLLERQQWIPRPIEEVFAFFADAGNLEKITPHWLNFQILSSEPKVIQSGTRLRYRLRWHSIPLNWLTEIQTWNPPNVFVDVQLQGPYKLWHHTHRFESVEGGTRMSDVVRYRLPFGFLGRLAHIWPVRSDLKAIFDYRALKVSEMWSPGCDHK